jgi:hypothetical protein
VVLLCVLVLGACFVLVIFSYVFDLGCLYCFVFVWVWFYLILCILFLKSYFFLLFQLVQTPLTDRCYLALTQALESRLGGNPFGPAGTGKTETVKALGGSLGKYVIVFCCDEGFDFQAMGRIFVGLCMCGAWGCFDEFNRLEERILSAVSQQIQQIQVSLKNKVDKVCLRFFFFRNYMFVSFLLLYLFYLYFYVICILFHFLLCLLSAFYCFAFIG